MCPAHPAGEESGCVFDALILCDGHVQLSGPSRGRHCPCAAERINEDLRDDLVTYPGPREPHIEIAELPA